MLLFHYNSQFNKSKLFWSKNVFVTEYFWVSLTNYRLLFSLIRPSFDVITKILKERIFKIFEHFVYK